jgi:hypothetical protein
MCSTVLTLFLKQLSAIFNLVPTSLVFIEAEADLLKHGLLLQRPETSINPIAHLFPHPT